MFKIDALKIKIPCILAVCFISFFSYKLNAQQVSNLFDQNDKLSSVQMHIHAMSNHGGHSKPASIQLHTSILSEINVNTIMWTEHAAVFEQNQVVMFSFKKGLIDSVTNNIVGLIGNPVFPVEFLATITGGDVISGLNDSSLMMQIRTNVTDTKLESFSYRPQGSKGSLKGVRYFNRPLSSSPVLSFNFLPNSINQHGEAFINVELTYHKYNDKILSQNLQYKFRSDVSVKSVNLIDSSIVEITIPIIENQKTLVTLDLSDDAIYLTDGLDNTIIGYDFGVSASNGSTTNVVFENIKLFSKDPDAIHQYNAFGQFIDTYFHRYNVYGFQGCEWAASNGMHFNGFLPDTTTDPDNLFLEYYLPYSEFTNRIINNGGIVTINHPFGTGSYIDNNSTLDYRTDTLATYYINNDVFNATIIEVGYDHRIGDRSHHMMLWDKLMANNYFIYGNGVSDLHGSGWERKNNNFCINIWEQYDSPKKILSALKHGRFYSVATKDVLSKFDFTVGEYRMGYKGKASCIVDTLKYQVDNNMSQPEFRLTQGLIKNGLDVEYLYNDFLLNPNVKMALRLDKPCFIRMTVTAAGDSEPFIISNPVFITGLTLPLSELLDCIKPKGKDLEFVFTVFPNPAIEFLNTELILLNDFDVSLFITDYKGNKVFTLLDKMKFKSGWYNQNWNIDKLSAGTYFINAVVNDNIVCKKFIILN